MTQKRDSQVAKQVDMILREIEELRALFVLGQRVIPFLEELFHFVMEVGPMLDEINRSLEESSNKIPKASDKLHTVTKATELATTEILDKLDEMTLKIGELKGYIAKVQSDLKRYKRAVKKLNRLINAGNLDEVRKQWGKFYDSFIPGFEVGNIDKKLSEIKEDADSIMIALQVQDITAQQISAVNHLISSVQEKLLKLLIRLGNLDMRRVVLDELPSELSFNPDAEYDRSGRKQIIVDEIVKSNSSEIRNDEEDTPASQEEIDKLFKGNEKQI